MYKSWRIGMKKVIAYSFYVMVLLLFVKYAVNFLNEKMDPVPYFYKSIFVPIILGLYLALPEFYYILNRPGHIVIDWIRLSVIGLPTLFIDLSVVLYYFTELGNTYAVQWSFQGYDLFSRTIIGIVFGYNLLVSFHKSEDFANEETKC